MIKYIYLQVPKIVRLLLFTVVIGFPSISFGWFGSQEIRMSCPDENGPNETVYRYEKDKKITVRERGKWTNFCWVVDGPVSDGKGTEFTVVQTEDVWELGGSCSSTITFPTETTIWTTSYDFEFFLIEVTQTIQNKENPLGRQVEHKKISCRKVD